MAQISALVTNVVFIIILTTVMDLLMPQSKLRDYIKLVMGLFVILAIVQPILALWQSDALLSGWIWHRDSSEIAQSIAAQSSAFTNGLTAEALDQYEQKLSAQMNALVALSDDVKASNVIVTTDGTTGAVKAVEIYLLTEPSAEETTAKKAIQLLTAYFSVAKDTISVHFLTEGDTGENQ